MPQQLLSQKRKDSEAPRLSKVGSVGIPIEQFPERSRAPLPALVVAGLIFVGSAVGSAVIGYYVEMGLDAMHEALAEDAEEEEEEEPEAKRR